MARNKDKPVIGRKDKIDLPEFGLYNLDAKVDTGAYGCSIHSHYIEKITDNGKEKVRFQLLDPSHPEYEHMYYETDQFGQKSVKNTSGISELRITIQTVMILFGKEYNVKFSLTNRSDMKYPILLGRKFLNKNYLVDTDKINLSYKSKKKTS